MKKLLPILLCYLLMVTQASAISGGPVFGAGGIDPTGVYSGTLLGATETPTDEDGNPTGVPIATNAIGLFSLGVPSTSTAVGSFLLFSDGVLFTGTIAAIVNPDSDAVTGIVEGMNTIMVLFPGAQATTSITQTATGGLTAFISGTRQGAAASAVLSGTASLDVSFGGIDAETLTPIIDREISFTVAGFPAIVQHHDRWHVYDDRYVAAGGSRSGC